MRFQFHTNCTDSNAVGDHGEDIHEMRNNPHNIELSSRNFISRIAKKIGIDQELISLSGCNSKNEFANDWGIKCHASYFQGCECFYMIHSGIEHIFIKEDDADKMRYGEDGKLRRLVIEMLEESFEKYKAPEPAGAPREVHRMLTTFVNDHLDEFRDNNILLGSLFTYRHEFDEKIIKRIDREIILSDDVELSSGYDS